jgi:hypothetical protein
MLRGGLAVVILEVGVNIGGSIADECVRSDSDDEGVTLVASLDVGILM